MEKTFEKRHYKLYKAKKHWVSAAIITASGTVLFFSAPTVSANETPSAEPTTAQTTTQLPQQTDTTTSVTDNDTQATPTQTDTLSNDSTQSVTSSTKTEEKANAQLQDTKEQAQTTTPSETPVTTEKTTLGAQTGSQKQVTTNNELTTKKTTKAEEESQPQATTALDHQKGNVAQAWEKGYTGQGMVVSVLDSGFDTTHKDFSTPPTTPRLTKEQAEEKANTLGYGRYASEKFPFVYNYASHSNDYIKDDGPNASQHGQHVAGIVAASGKPQENAPYAVGVAPDSQVLGMRVFNDEFADEEPDNIAQAIYDSVALGANVIHMSLGQGVARADLNNVEQKAVEYAVQHGVFVSVSASNSGHAGSVYNEDAPYSPGGANGSFEPFSSSTVANPAASLNALTVAAENSALGNKSEMASFSSWGPLPDFTLKPDLSAPGVRVVSTANDDGYKTMSGTSMAGPFAAGAAALVMQRLLKETDLKNKDLVVAAKALLMNTAEPMVDQVSGQVVSPRRQGAGQINVGSAVSSPVFVTSKDDTGSVSLHKLTGNDSFDLTFTNLSSQDQTYTFDDLTGGLTEVRDTEDGRYFDEKLPNASVTGTKTFTVKAGQKLTLPFTLNLKDVQKNQLVEGFLRFTNVASLGTLVVPYLGFFGDLTHEDVFDKAANDKENIYGGNFFVNEHNYPRGIADEQSLKKLVNLDGEYDWQQVAKLYQDGKVAFSPNNDNHSDLLKPFAFVKQNLEDLKVTVLDKDGNVVRVVADEKGLDKSISQDDYNKDVSLSVSMRNDPTTFDWDGKVYDKATGEYKVAPDGQYTYQFIATLHNDGAKKTQSASYPVVIDTTAPELLDPHLLVNDAGTKGVLSFEYQDLGAGFTDYSYALVTINGQVFGHKLNEGASSFRDSQKTKGQAFFDLTQEELAALTQAKNLVTLKLSDVADNVSTTEFVVPGVSNSQKQVSVWNATPGMAFDLTSSDYDENTKTYQLKGSATTDFYYDHQLVSVKDGLYTVSVSPDVSQVTFTSDQAGQNVLLSFSTQTKKAAFAWQKAHTTVQNFGLDLDTVVTNDPEHVTVYAQVTNAPNVKAFARDYFTGKVYEGTVKDGLARFDVQVSNGSLRTVLVGWTEVSGPTFNVVQTTRGTRAYLGVNANPKNQAQTFSPVDVSELETGLSEELADPDQLGAPTALPGHRLADLTTRSEPNPLISFEGLKDNDYNWLGAQAIADGLYDPLTQTFTVRGKVDPSVTKLTMLGDSFDEADPKNNVVLAKDGSFSFRFKVLPTQQRPLAYSYVTKDGEKTRGTLQLVLDTVLPTLEFENVSSYKFDGTNYYVYTNEPTFTLKGSAQDNLDGYRFFVNGDNNFRQYHQSGVNYGNPYEPYLFQHTFDLVDGALQQVYTLEVRDVVNNKVTRKFYVYYQPKRTTSETVEVTQDKFSTVVSRYPDTQLYFFNKETQQFEPYFDAQKPVVGLYQIVNKYGNPVKLLQVVATPVEKSDKENEASKDTTDSTDSTATKQFETTTHTSNTTAKESNAQAKLTDVTAKNTADQADKSASKVLAPNVKNTTTKEQTTKQTAGLPQLGNEDKPLSFFGIVALSLASLLSFFGLTKKPEKR